MTKRKTPRKHIVKAYLRQQRPEPTFTGRESPIEVTRLHTARYDPNLLQEPHVRIYDMPSLVFYDNKYKVYWGSTGTFD